MSALVTITTDMPLPEQLRLLDEGRQRNATIVFVGDWHFAEALQDYADNGGDYSAGDPGYQDRYTADAFDREYVRQTDGHHVMLQEWMR